MRIAIVKNISIYMYENDELRNPKDKTQLKLI